MAGIKAVGRRSQRQTSQPAGKRAAKAKSAGKGWSARSSATKAKSAAPGESAPKKPLKSLGLYHGFDTIEARQKEVERARRAVFARMEKIMIGNLNLAEAGNNSAAKFLFEFAGVYELPPLAQAGSEAAESKPPSPQPAEAEDPVAAMFTRLGMTQPVYLDEAPVQDEDDVPQDTPALVAKSA